MSWARSSTGLNASKGLSGIDSWMDFGGGSGERRILRCVVTDHGSVAR